MGYHCRKRDAELAKKPWQFAPPQAEDYYTVEDALVVGGMLITLINNSSRVRIACLAQLVNVLAPIMTEENGDGIWKNTIFYPYFYASNWGRGETVYHRVDCEKYDCNIRDGVPYLSSAVVRDAESKTLSLFLLNRAPEPMRTELRGFAGETVKSGTHAVLSDAELKAGNTPLQPDRVRMTVKPIHPGFDGTLVLPAFSWSAVRLCF